MYYSWTKHKPKQCNMDKETRIPLRSSEHHISLISTVEEIDKNRWSDLLFLCLKKMQNELSDRFTFYFSFISYLEYLSREARYIMKFVRLSQILKLTWSYAYMPIVTKYNFAWYWNKCYLSKHFVLSYFCNKNKNHFRAFTV